MVLLRLELFFRVSHRENPNRTGDGTGRREFFPSPFGLRFSIVRFLQGLLLNFLGVMV